MHCLWPGGRQLCLGTQTCSVIPRTCYPIWTLLVSAPASQASARSLSSLLAYFSHVCHVGLHNIVTAIQIRVQSSLAWAWTESGWSGFPLPDWVVRRGAAPWAPCAPMLCPVALRSWLQPPPAHRALGVTPVKGNSGLQWPWDSPPPDPYLHPHLPHPHLPHLCPP